MQLWRLALRLSAIVDVRRLKVKIAETLLPWYKPGVKDDVVINGVIPALMSCGNCSYNTYLYLLTYLLWGPR